MAPDGYRTGDDNGTAPDTRYHGGADNGTTVTLTFNVSFGDTRTCATTVSADSSYYLDYEEACSRLKQARRDWLRFTRGRGWSDISSVPCRVGSAVVRRNRIQPALRAKRRSPRQYRWHTLKQLRRLGVL